MQALQPNYLTIYSGIRSRIGNVKILCNDLAALVSNRRENSSTG